MYVKGIHTMQIILSPALGDHQFIDHHVVQRRPSEATRTARTELRMT